MAAAVAGGLLAVAVPGGAGSAHATELLDNLTCQGPATLTFADPLTDTVAANSFTLSGKFDLCYSKDGSETVIDHGTITSSGSGAALSCNTYHPFSGTATFTWYDKNKEYLGTTTVSYQGGEKGSATVNELANDETGITDATSSLLGLNNFQGNFTPTGFTGDCETSGLTSLTGDYNVDFSLASLRAPAPDSRR